MQTETIGERIKRFREGKAKLNREQLGGAVGVSRQAVKKWEDGDTQNMKLQNLMKLCQIFEITAEELITGAERYETGGSVLRYISEPATRSYAAKDKDEQEIISIMESITEKGIGYLLHAAREASRQFSKDQPKGAASSSP